MDWATIKRTAKWRRVRYGAALARPEFRGACQAAARKATGTGPTSPPVKIVDPDTRRLIDEALARRR